jgi:hypothetical protein
VKRKQRERERERKREDEQNTKLSITTVHLEKPKRRIIELAEVFFPIFFNAVLVSSNGKISPSVWLFEA